MIVRYLISKSPFPATMFTKLIQRFRPVQAPLPRPAAPPKPRPIHVNDDDFEKVILGSDKLAVVDFWAEWCEPCHLMAATIQFLAEDYAGQLIVAKLNVEENPVTPARYNLLGIPTLIFFRNGEEVDRHTGIVSIEQLGRQVEELLAREDVQRKE